MTTAPPPTLRSAKLPQEQLDQAIFEADTAWRAANKDKAFSHYLARAIEAKVIPHVAITLNDVSPDDINALLLAIKDGQPGQLFIVEKRQPEVPISAPNTRDDWRHNEVLTGCQPPEEQQHGDER